MILVTTFTNINNTVIHKQNEIYIRWQTATNCSSGVPRGGSTPHPPRNSELLTKLRQIPSSVENTSVTTLHIPKIWQSRTELQIERKPWLGGYRSRSPFSLPSVLNWICWTPLEKNSWVRHWIAVCKVQQHFTTRLPELWFPKSEVLCHRKLHVSHPTQTR
jgi:hypothetical protein